MKSVVAMLMISQTVGCCLVSAREMNWDALFPLDAGPDLLVARFRVAVTLGDIDIAYDCLSPQTRAKMSKTRFQLAMASDYEVEYEGYKIPLRRFICSARLIDIDKDETKAEVLLEWGKMWVTIFAKRIGERWYLALYESLSGQK